MKLDKRTNALSNYSSRINVQVNVLNVSVSLTGFGCWRYLAAGDTVYVIVWFSKRRFLHPSIYYSLKNLCSTETTSSINCWRSAAGYRDRANWLVFISSVYFKAPLILRTTESLTASLSHGLELQIFRLILCSNSSSLAAFLQTGSFHILEPGNGWCPCWRSSHSWGYLI